MFYLIGGVLVYLAVSTLWRNRTRSCRLCLEYDRSADPLTGKSVHFTDGNGRFHLHSWEPGDGLFV